MTFDEEVRKMLEECFWHERPSIGVCKYHLKYAEAITKLKSLILSKIPEEKDYSVSIVINTMYEGYNQALKDMKDNLGV